MASYRTIPATTCWVPDTLGRFPVTTDCFPLGSHLITYIVTDDCGNTTDCQFFLTVRDLGASVSFLGEETTVVSIVSDNPLDCYGPAARTTYRPLSVLASLAV